WSSDVCSSDLGVHRKIITAPGQGPKKICAIKFEVVGQIMLFHAEKHSYHAVKQSIHRMFQKWIMHDASAFDKARTDHAVAVPLLHCVDEQMDLTDVLDEIAVHRQGKFRTRTDCAKRRPQRATHSAWRRTLNQFNLRISG